MSHINSENSEVQDRIRTHDICFRGRSNHYPTTASLHLSTLGQWTSGTLNWHLKRISIYAVCTTSKASFSLLVFTFVLIIFILSCCLFVCLFYYYLLFQLLSLCLSHILLWCHLFFPPSIFNRKIHFVTWSST